MPNLQVHFTHASLNTFMSTAKNAEDVDRLASGNRDWVTLTETAQAETVAMIRKVVGDRYKVVNPDAGDITFLVRPEHQVLGAGGEVVIPAVNKPAKDGGHGPRFNSHVRIKVGAEDITHTGMHMVTAKAGDGTRFPQQVKQADVMGSRMTQYGKGGRLATGSGDLNAVLPDRNDIQAVFDKYGLTTSARETHVQDPTEGGRRIDYVWTRDADGRLTVTNMKVRHGEQWNSDHDPIDVWAEIAPQGGPSLDHKLWVPGAIRRPIAKTSSDPFIIPVGGIFHIGVTNASSLFQLFSNDGGIESTGYIRLDGTFEQYRPLNVQCDAQFDGNSFARPDGRLYGFNSWESQGGFPDGGGTWTDAQLAKIKDIIRFQHDQWGNPLRLAPAFNADGFGYHRLYDAWNHNHHSCPGPERVRQFNDIIVPWLKSGGR